MVDKEFAREISANTAKHFIVIYFAINSIRNSINSLETCVKNAMNDIISHNCSGDNILPCIDVVLSKLSECHEQSTLTVAKAMQDLVYSPFARYAPWFKPSDKDKSIAETVQRTVIPHINVADAILWFLVSNARLFFREDLPRYMASTDEIVVERLREPMVKMLMDHGVVVSSDRDFYTTSVLVKLLDIVIRELEAAGDETASILNHIVSVRFETLSSAL